MAEQAREPSEAEIAANVAKTLAETKKAESESEAALAAAEKSRSEARKELALALDAEYKAVAARHDADRADEKRRDELAADKYHHTYLFDKDVSDANVKACITQLSNWERTSDKPLTIELVINSPGGDVVAGFALVDYIISMNAREHVVNTTAYGMAASMGGVLLQVGKTRRMGSNAVLLIHEAQFGAVGSYGDIQDRVKLVDIFHERILKLFTDRSKVSKQFIKSHWARTDWWLSADISLKHGFCDEVI